MLAVILKRIQKIYASRLYDDEQGIMKRDWDLDLNP